MKTVRGAVKQHLGRFPMEPRDDVLDVVNILLLLSFRIGVIKSQKA